MKHTSDPALDLEPELEHRLRRVASVDTDVLITGPTGSGKTAVARRIHALSRRKEKPFFAQNCGAIPGELAESTLFGHEAGAFTGAHKAASGIIEAAEMGTLFLDEIGELSQAVQAKLLTVLQDRVYSPVGSTKTRSANFRLIAATNRDLVEQCNRGLFRIDLYQRINGLPIALRPLRETPDRALRIAAERVKEAHYEPEVAEKVLSAVGNLNSHPFAWPGNIRELESFVLRCWLGVDEEESRIRDEWSRWRRPESAEQLTPIRPSTSASLDERQRYAEVIHTIATQGGRPKAAFSRKGSMVLASRLLDARPEPLSMDEVQEALGLRTSRQVKPNLDMLVKNGLVELSKGGVLARWPPATSTIFRRAHNAWIPAGSGEIMALEHKGRVRVEVASRLAGTLSIMLITHRSKSVMEEPSMIIEGQELVASKPTAVQIELVGAGGFEQILVHVAPAGHRGGRLVETTDDAIMPSPDALERGRRMALDRWHEGWLAEHLVFLLHRG